MSDNLNGIIIVNKEKGFTSHDVVNVMRKILKTKKVGHTGTLDPEATGVLPICFGNATKVADMITLSDKEYITELKLGIVTDTQDIWGEVISKNEVLVTKEEFERAIKSFIGNIKQIPPMYSAIKVNGKKLYEYAREGKEIDRQERDVTVFDIEILEIKNDTAKIKVKCSKGLYVRTLCHDIGQKLGCGACMTSLERTKSSVFTLENAYTLDELKEIDIEKVIMPTEDVFMHLPLFVANEEIEKRLINGAVSSVKAEKGLYRIRNTDGKFFCVGKVYFYNGRNVIKSDKLFL